MKCLSASVVPLTRLPRGIDFFDYAIPLNLADSIRVGSKVVIPFRSKKIDGVVWNITEQTTERTLKDIFQVVPESPLSEEILRLVEWAARFYACSLSLIMQQACGPRLKKQLANRKPQSIVQPQPSQKKLFSQQDISVIRWTDYAWRDVFLKNIVADHLNKRQQLMILCPTVARCQEVYNSIKDSAGESTLVFTSGVGIREEVASRDRLRDASALIAIGTRSIVFADMPRLATILIDKSHRDEHAQYDMNPRYDSRTVAYKRAEFGKKLILTSPAPRLEDWHHVHQGGEFQEHLSPVPRHSIVALSDVWRSRQKGFISDVLIRATQASLENGKDAFYFVNKKGYASHLVCRDCDWMFECRSCRTPLPGTQSRKSVICRVCTESAEVPVRCPSCKSVRFSLPGIGLEKIAEQIRALFPSVRCLEISNDTIDSADVREYMKSGAPSNTIAVGTSLLPQEHGKIFQKFGVVGILAADAISSQMNFRAHELQWRIITALSMLSARHASHLVVQAFMPESQFIQDLISDRYDAFAKRTLAERETFNWPPFGRCVVILPKASKKHPSQSLKEVLSVIKETCAKETVIRLHVLDRGKPNERILIRFPQWSPTALPQIAYDIFNSIPPEWLVDTDPLSL